MATLSFEYDYDFQLIGLYCHFKDYRLAWALNKRFEFDFVKQDPYSIKNKEDTQEFSYYTFLIEHQELYYYLLANRSEQGLLIPERKDIDYFIIIDGIYERSKKKEFLSQLSALNEVLSAVEVNPKGLRSKQNLLME